MPEIKTDEREAPQVRQAIELIELGARMPLLESELQLGRERLLALYEEVTGVPPALGRELPADWFVTWQPNIHASLFVAIWRYLDVFLGLHGLDALVQAYRLYLGHMQATAVSPVLSLTRAWTLIRYLGVLLDTAPCAACGNDFVVHFHETDREACCGLCRPPFNALEQPCAGFAIFR